MKKILTLLLIVTMSFGLVACSSSDSSKATATPEATATAEATAKPSATPEASASTETMADLFTTITKGLEMPSTVALDADQIKTNGLTTDDYTDIYWAQPLMAPHATMIVLVDVADGKMTDVQAALDKYFTDYEAQWKTYLPDQYELVVNRLVIEEGNIYAVIISDNAAKIGDNLLNAIGK